MPRLRSGMDVTSLICPICAAPNDEALSPSGRLPPQDWHPIACVGCGAILVIDHAWPGGLRVPQQHDWAAWHSDPRLAAALTLTAYQTRNENPNAR